MSYRNERLSASFLSLDRFAESIDPVKSRIFSDNGEGARRILLAADSGTGSLPVLDGLVNARAARSTGATREGKLAEARRRLVEAGLERLLPVLEQVVANGRNRRESIMRLAMMRRVNKRSSERFYDRGVKALLTFFSPNEIKGETRVDKSSCL